MFTDIPGVCASEDIWSLRSTTDPGGRPLPAALPVEVRL